MTVDVPTAVLVSGALGALGAAATWVARTTVFERLASLEDKQEKNARRFGEGDHDLDKRLTVVEAELTWKTTKLPPQ